MFNSLFLAALAVLLLPGCSASSKVPQASGTSSSSDASLSEGNGEASKKKKSTSSSSTDGEEEDESDNEDDTEKSKSSDGELDLTAIEKDADECKKSKKYYDLTNAKCTDKVLADFSCSNSALIDSDSSKIKAAIGDTNFQSFKTRFKSTYAGYEFKFCLPDTKDDKAVYRLVAWKKSDSEIKSQPFYIPKSD